MLETSSLPLRDNEISTTDRGVHFSQGREWALSIIERADEIAGAADSSCLIPDLLDLMIEVALAESAYFFQLDTATDELMITHVRGDAESQHLLGLSLNRQQGFSGVLLDDSKIIVIGDLTSDSDWLYSVDPVNAARKRNVINLPVAYNDRTLGIVQLFNFQQTELDLLLVLGKRLALEIVRHREIEMTQQSNKRLITLVDMLGEGAGILDRNRLLHLAAENASRLVDAERSSIFLVDPKTNEMLFQVSYRSPEHGSLPSSDRDGNITSVKSRQDIPVRDNSSRRTNRNKLPDGEFSYFNRSAITVPLSSEPLIQEYSDSRKHILGGLMVFNSQSNLFKEEDAQLMRILADQTSIFLQVAEIYEGTSELFFGAIKSLVAAIDAKDSYTQGHSQRVSDFSVLIARELGLDETSVNDIRIGSLLHDIGKIGIPDSILLKEGKLTNKEYDVIKRHPRTGINILSQVKLLEPICPAISEHHERLDGSGYPDKLAGKQISLMGRIVAVADVYDAMTSDRPYRKGLSSQEVLSYLHKTADILFDAQCVQALDDIILTSK